MPAQESWWPVAAFYEDAVTVLIIQIEGPGHANQAASLRPDSHLSQQGFHYGIIMDKVKKAEDALALAGFLVGLAIFRGANRSYRFTVLPGNEEKTYRGVQ